MSDRPSQDQEQLQHSKDEKRNSLQNRENRAIVITVAGHEVMRNLDDPGDQTLMYLDVHVDSLRSISHQTPLKALKA